MIYELARMQVRVGLAMLLLAALVRLVGLPPADAVADDLAMLVSLALVGTAAVVLYRERGRSAEGAGVGGSPMSRAEASKEAKVLPTDRRDQ